MEPQVIAGRYEVLRAIGSGGMGTVWLCRDNVLDREVAVKRVGALPGDPAAAARAMREARIAASLNDPHAVGVYDIVDQDDAHWLVMEYVAGQTLAEQIHEQGALAPTRVAAIGAAVAGALARAHDRGIVHRDIKPGNVLLDAAGTPKISDFGIARATADDQLTQTGFMTGTPGYLSPELARGGDPTPGSDVWALGATLYYAVEGEPAFPSQANPLATLQAIASGQGRPLHRAGPLGGAIAAMMDRDPQRRWDMHTAAERLRRIADGDATFALPAGAALAAEPTEVLPAANDTQRLPPGVPPTGAAANPPPAAPPPAPRQEQDRGGNRAAVVLVALVVLALLGLGVAYLLTDGFGSNRPTPRTTTTVTSTPSQATTPPRTSSSSSSSKPTSTTSTTSSSTTSTTSSPPADPAAMERFVSDYYRDVTKENKRDATFALLTPGMQERSGGRDGYEAFWSGIKSVDVRDVQANAETGEVIVQLTFKPDKGDPSEETHRLMLVRDADGWLIDLDAKG